MSNNVVPLSSQEPQTATERMLALITRPEGVARADLKKLGLDRFNFKVVLKRRGYELRTQKRGKGSTHYWATKRNIAIRERGAAAPTPKEESGPPEDAVLVFELRRELQELKDQHLDLQRKYIELLEKR